MNKELYTTMPAGVGGKQIDLDAISVAFAETVLTPLASFIDAEKTSLDEAKEQLQDAIDAYKDDKESRKAALEGKIDSLRAAIEECQLKSEIAVKRLGAAISAGDSVAEEKAKNDVDKASAAEFTARRRLEALSRVEITGNNDLFCNVIERYAALKINTKVCALIDSFIEVATQKLDDVLKSAQGIRDNPARGRVQMRKVWPIIEEHGGIVDFSCATAGDEDNCKLRYLEALAARYPDPGFAGSPASVRLAADIEMLIDHDEIHAAADAPEDE